MLTDFEQALIERDELSRTEAREALREARLRIVQGDDPEEVLEDYGLEPDYVMDLL